MRFLVSEKLSEHRFKTPEGYLVCTDAILARTGTQEYKRSELFGDSCDNPDETITVNRSADQVFDSKTLASFENKPLTVEHPDEDVDCHNNKEYSVGFVRDVKRGLVDGQDVMLGTVVITDAEVIKDIENGIRTELSCGYDCDVTDGDNPQQRNIRGNHVALCERGRAGIARLVDSIHDNQFIAEGIVTRIYGDKTSAKFYVKADGREYQAVTQNDVLSKGAASLGDKVKLYRTESGSYTLTLADSAKDARKTTWQVTYRTSDGNYPSVIVVAEGKDEAIRLAKQKGATNIVEANEISPERARALGLDSANDESLGEFVKRMNAAGFDVSLRPDFRKHPHYGSAVDWNARLQRIERANVSREDKERLKRINTDDVPIEELAKRSRQLFGDSIKDAGSQLWQYHQCYAIIPKKYYDKYKSNAYVEAVEYDIEAARYHRSSLERCDGIAYVIINTYDNKYKLEDSKVEDADFSNRTKQGYEVIEMYRDGGRLHVIFKRANDYGVGLGYDTTDGQWAQGMYDFRNVAEARQALQETKPYARRIMDAVKDSAEYDDLNADIDKYSMNKKMLEGIVDAAKRTKGLSDMERQKLIMKANALIADLNRMGDSVKDADTFFTFDGYRWRPDYFDSLAKKYNVKLQHLGNKSSFVGPKDVLEKVRQEVFDRGFAVSFIADSIKDNYNEDLVVKTLKTYGISVDYVQEVNGKFRIKLQNDSDAHFNKVKEALSDYGFDVSKGGYLIAVATKDSVKDADNFYTVSYIGNGVNQIIAVRANSADEAKQKFLDYAKSKNMTVTISGVSEGAIMKPGLPVIDKCGTKDSFASKLNGIINAVKAVKKQKNG